MRPAFRARPRAVITVITGITGITGMADIAASPTWPERHQPRGAAVTVALKDDLFDAQFMRALAYAAAGGAEFGECWGTASRITHTDGDLWYSQWLATAQRVEG